MDLPREHIAEEFSLSSKGSSYEEKIRKDGKALKVKFRDFSSVQMRTFHVTWITFFMCFFGWFSLPPLLTQIQEDLGITKDQVITTNQASIGMTIICRVCIGLVCDKYGARRTYTLLLLLGSIPVMLVGLATDYTSLLICRLFIGGLGAGFVITQYHTGMMFAPKIIGFANATSAGWGNFGGGVANALMPHIANLMVVILPFATPTTAWRYSSAFASVLLMMNSIAYFKLTQDTPHGNIGYERAPDGYDDDFDAELPDTATAQEDSSETTQEDSQSQSQAQEQALADKGTIAVIPVIEGGVGHVVGDGKAPEANENDIAVVEVPDAVTARRKNMSIHKKFENYITHTLYWGVISDYRVAILVVAYGCCFGVELIMLSMASLYFQQVHGLSKEKSGALVLAFSAMNLFARSVGGFFSDKLSKRGLQYRVYWLTICLTLEGLLIILFSFMTNLIALIFVIFIFGIMTMICEGATFGVVPFINSTSYGLVAGLVGAGGNTGAVLGMFLFQFGIKWTDSFLYLGIIVVSVACLTVFIRFPKIPVQDDDSKPTNTTVIEMGDQGQVDIKKPGEIQQEQSHKTEEVGVDIKNY